jgi:predicted membrane protein
MIYQAIGRLVVWVVLKRFGRQLRIAAVLAIVGVGIAGYLAASRSVDEG